MEVRPILSAMRRNKMGAFLISIQTAITLAVLCNGLFIIQQRLALSKRPTGTDETNIFAIVNQWVGEPRDLSSRSQVDIVALRSIPGVIDAYATNAYPLTNSGWTDAITLHHGEEQQTMAQCAVYFADEHTINTLGLKLIAGRNFNTEEITDRDISHMTRPAGIIITRALADKLFPGGNALGQSVYLELEKQSTPIVGVVEKLQVPWTTAMSGRFIDSSMLVPAHFISSSLNYIVRSQSGQLAQVMRAADSKLMEVDPTRIIDKVQPLSAARVEVYRDDRGLAIILAVVCTTLVAVTGFGIVGLTSYWVTQRRRQIGIRRALGATRTNIVHYFQTENLLIAALGTLAGAALAVAMNLWMVSSFEMARLNYGYTLIGGFIVLMIGQAAVLFPALRAASVPPALATRDA